MPGEVEQNFELIEQRVLKLTGKYKNVVEKHRELSLKYQNLKEKNEALVKAFEELQEQHKRMKITAALSGNEEHSRLIKRHINRLVKEVDFCIAQIKNHGI